MALLVNPIFFDFNFLSESKIEKILDLLNITASSNQASFTVSASIMSIAVILLSGFLLTRITKLLKLPNVTAYIIAGVLIGPYVLNLIPESIISGTEFLSDIALAFVAFSAGEFFKIEDLKKAGIGVILITIFESILSFVLVFVVTGFILKINLSFSLVLAALSSTTAPASTLMTIRQTGAKGEYVNTLLEVVALDDVVALVLYSLSISICIMLSGGSGTVTFKSIIWPIAKSIICLVLGFGFGFILRLLLPKRRTADNRLIIVIAILFAFCGICLLFDESPLLGCMAIGMVYTNTKEKEDKLFKQLNYFSPPIMLIFFVRSGMSFNLNAFNNGEKLGIVPLLIVALIYFFVRIIGKYVGAFLGSLITKRSKPIRNYLGLALIPQAGVAIGLATMGARTFIDAGQIELGNALLTIILASSILYELIGPACSKLGLYLSHSYSNDLDEIVPVDDDKNTVDKLIEQINQIQATLPEIQLDENEIAFTEAADEYDYENTYRRNNNFINRKGR